MKQSRSVLVNLHAGFERAREVRLAGLAYETVEYPVRRAGGDDRHSHSAPGSAHEGVAHRIVRNEIGVRQVDRRPRALDGEQEEEVSLGGPARRGALDRLDGEIADAVRLREIGVTSEEDARRVAPVLGEGGLEQVD